MSIHVAMTIFCANKPDAAHYTNQVMRIRSYCFAKQKNVSEFTILTNPQGIDDTPLQYIHNVLVTKSAARRFRIVYVHGLDHAGSGLVQEFVETDCDWVYLDEDAHTLPLHASSICRPVDAFEKMLPGVDAVFDSNGEVSSSSRSPFIPDGLRTIKNKEWGHWQKSSTLRTYKRPGTINRNYDASIFAYQGAVVGCTRAHSAYFMHHNLYAGPSCLESLDPEDVEYKIFEAEQGALPGIGGRVRESIEKRLSRHEVEVQDIVN